MELCVITGGSSGIGAAIERRADAAGATTATISRNPERGRFRLAADLSNPGEWHDTVRWLDSLVAEQAPSRVVFVHCAATLAPIGFAGEVDQASYADNAVLNGASPQVLGAGFIGVMISREIPGVLVHITSGAASKPYPGWSGYCAGKAAVDHWTRTVGAELDRRGRDTKVLAIAPGVVDTPMQDHIREMDEEHFPKVERFRSLEREGELRDPDSVADRIWALAHDDEIENGSVLDVRDLET